MGRNFTPDQELIDRLLLNDTLAFEELYRRYWYSLYSYCSKKLRSSDDARGIVRKIFIDLWENRHSTPVDFSISQYLYSNVRLAVVESLTARLESVTEDELIGEEVLSSFSVKALESARQPVAARKEETEEVELIHRRQQVDEVHKNYNPFNVKWLSQLVSIKATS